MLAWPLLCSDYLFSDCQDEAKRQETDVHKDRVIVNRVWERKENGQQQNTVKSFSFQNGFITVPCCVDT